MESEHQNGTRDGLTINTNKTSGEENHISHGKSLSSSSSSSGSPFELNVTDNRRLSSADQIVSPGNDNDHGISGHETHPSHASNPNNESPVQSPSPQMMTIDPLADSTPSAYRIPSYVFAGSKSPAAMDWSVASNESLFSIHMGNMSFTKDLNWLPGDPMMSPMPDFSSKKYLSNQSPTSQKVEKGQPNMVADASYGITELRAAETMREVIKENEASRADEEKQNAKKSTFSQADASRASVNSFAFAFPKLTGDREEKQQRPSKKPVPPPENQSVANEQQEMQQKTVAETNQPHQTNNNAGQSKWFSCFPCCSSGS